MDSNLLSLAPPPFLRAISAAFFFVIPTLLGSGARGDNGVGNAAKSFGSGDSSGVARGLEDGESAKTRASRAVCAVDVRADITDGHSCGAPSSAAVVCAPSTRADGVGATRMYWRAFDTSAVVIS